MSNVLGDIWSRVLGIHEVPPKEATLEPCQKVIYKNRKQK